MSVMHTFLRSNVLDVLWVIQMHHDPLLDDDGVNLLLQRLEGRWFVLHLSCHCPVEVQKADTLQFLYSVLRHSFSFLMQPLRTFHRIRTSENIIKSFNNLQNECASLGVRCGCVCVGSGFGCAPPLMARVLGCVCVYMRAPLVPRLSWLGCAAWVRVLVLRFPLRPANPGWRVEVCVPLCARSVCTPPFLAGASGVWVPGVAWHLFLCLGLLRVVRAAGFCGTRLPLLLGNSPCAFVVAGGVPLWRASWPRVVRRASSEPVILGALVGFPEAVVHPGGLRPRIYLVAARGTRRPANNRAHSA